MGSVKELKSNKKMKVDSNQEQTYDVINFKYEYGIFVGLIVNTHDHFSIKDILFFSHNDFKVILDCEKNCLKAVKVIENEKVKVISEKSSGSRVLEQSVEFWDENLPTLSYAITNVGLMDELSNILKVEETTNSLKSLVKTHKEDIKLAQKTKTYFLFDLRRKE